MKRLLIILAVLVMAVAACDIGDLVLSPKDGAIVSEDMVAVTGKLPPSLTAGGVLRVNGVVVPVNPDRTWSASVPQSPSGYTTDIAAIYTDPSNIPWRQRFTVVHGPKLDEGQFSPDGVGMRFTNTGLANLGPVVQKLAGSAFDISGLLLAQHPLIQQNDVFLDIDLVANAYEAGLGGVGMSASSTTSGVATHITIKDLYIGLDMNLQNFLINQDCRLELKIPTTTIDANFDLKPSAADPSFVDVNMIGAPVVNTGNVGYEFISGLCDGDIFLIGDIVNALAGSQIPGLVGGGFSSQLGDPDGSGPADSPIVDAIETALSQISIAGAVGEATKVNLRAPFTQINETSTAIDFRSNADFYSSYGNGPTDCVQKANAPDLASTFDVPGAYPSLGATTPTGDPYGLGLVVSNSAFNQLLGAMTECGILNQDITTLTLGGQQLPLTSTLLSSLAPEFGTKLPPGTPMKIRVIPTVGPFLTSASGPNGETSELELANLKLQFIREVDIGGGNLQEVKELELAVDAPLGFDLQFDEQAGVLAPVITPPPGFKVRARVINNTLGTSEPAIEYFFAQIFPSFVGGLSSTFASFPLPSFLGLKLNVVDVARDGNYYVLYSNLDPILQTRIQNVSITDLSSGDSVTDAITDVNEWRHRIRPKISESQVKVDFKGMIGVDACCFTDDESKSAHAGYRVTLDAVPENGETWKLDISDLIAGAHTLIDDSLADCKAESRFTTAITGRARIGSGAWQNFNFNPSVMSVGSTGSSTNQGFSGSAATSLQANTAQTVTVEFGFDVFVKSTSQGFPPCGGNEAALRFGANDTISNAFSAGEYPGVGNRNILNDGHKSTIQLTTLP